MSSFINFNIEQPRITALKLATVEDLNSFALGLRLNSQKLQNAQFDFEASEIKTDETSVFVEGKGLIALLGEFIIWNQTGKTYVVSSEDGEWSDSLVPSELVIPVATRRIF